MLGLTIYIALILLCVRCESTENYKTILYYHFVKNHHIVGSEIFKNNNCPYSNCTVTLDPARQHEVDAVVFRRDYHPEHLFVERPTDQLWIYFTMESPLTVRTWREFAKRNIFFNMTMSYRLDSTIPVLYGQTVRKSYNHINEQELTGHLGKTKAVVWLVSNCRPFSKRLEYAHELGKYIAVDIFGKCGTNKCPKNSGCQLNKIVKPYKFYLSFENSICEDYITEKLWINAYRTSTVPIVMGARRSTYESLAPPNSFIHVDDYSSPARLAAYLRTLMEDDELYNSYFQWKHSYNIVSGAHWLCSLCEVVTTRDGYENWYPDFDDWWYNEDVCVLASDENPYASWVVEDRLKKEKQKKRLH